MVETTSQDTSLTFSLRELRRLEDERVAGEIAEAVAEEERRRRDAAAAHASRELAERIARVQGELAVERERHVAERERHAAERERHAAERTRAELELAGARAAAPPRWPLRTALTAVAATLALAVLWLDARIAAARHDTDRALAAASSSLASDVTRRLDLLSVRLDALDRVARAASTSAAHPPSAPPPPSAPKPPRPAPPKPASSPAIKPCGTASPLGCLHH